MVWHLYADTLIDTQYNVIIVSAFNLYYDRSNCTVTKMSMFHHNGDVNS